MRSFVRKQRCGQCQRSHQHSMPHNTQTELFRMLSIGFVCTQPAVFFCWWRLFISKCYLLFSPSDGNDFWSFESAHEASTIPERSRSGQIIPAQSASVQLASAAQFVGNRSQIGSSWNHVGRLVSKCAQHLQSAQSSTQKCRSLYEQWRTNSVSSSAAISFLWPLSPFLFTFYSKSTLSYSLRMSNVCNETTT